ncbi:anion permease [Pseudocitrobacter cyperus]|uniref:Anion permease n=1 Tax=Pseudocitrobacter cyperus TaxID=3112843 RepID=A0ABV0HI30_9ENTR
MRKNMLWKLLILIAIPVVMSLFPAPEGLSELAWVLSGIYMAAIVGLVIKPFSEPVVLLIAIAVSMVVVGNLGDGSLKASSVLSGYASGTTWLVFSAFTLSAAFVITGLGKRIAYLLIGKIGSTTLGLGYVTAFLDLVLAPATPSNTARAGGIVLPIISSIAVALGSDPEKSSKRAGHYLMMNVYMVTKTTSYMFFTAMAGNILALKMIEDICHIKLSWGGWALAGGVPGLIMLLLTPLITYKLNPPELKRVDNKKIAKEGLAALGPMTLREKMLTGLFVLALVGWIFSKSLGVDEATVAICVMSLMLVLQIVTWDDVIKNKGGWNTLIWYGGIIGLSSLLSKVGFFSWLGETLKDNISFGGHGTIAFIVIVLLSILVRYFFASGSAYIVAMVPVFAMLANASGAPIMLTALALLFSNSYGGMVTHYGGAAGPVIFGLGYNDSKTWWITGGILTLLTFIIHMTLGVWWWELLMYFNII